MVESDFKTLAREVIENWRNERVPLNAGATEDELLAHLLCQDKEERFFVSSQVNLEERLADSFGHFLQRYLAEPVKIYLWVCYLWV